jgi:hypothetical protein
MEAKLEKDKYAGEDAIDLRMSHNGHQWTVVSLYNLEEVKMVAQLLNEYIMEQEDNRISQPKVGDAVIWYTGEYITSSSGYGYDWHPLNKQAVINEINGSRYFIVCDNDGEKVWVNLNEIDLDMDE